MNDRDSEESLSPLHQFRQVSDGTERMRVTQRHMATHNRIHTETYMNRKAFHSDSRNTHGHTDAYAYIEYRDTDTDIYMIGTHRHL